MYFILKSVIMRVFRFIGRFAKYFSNVTDWVRRVIGSKSIEGIRYYVQNLSYLTGKIVKTVREIIKEYWRNGNQWKETTSTIDIPASKVPGDILDKATYSSNHITDVTTEYEQSLQY